MGLDPELIEAVKEVSRALRDLGNADAATPMGAIEALGVAVREAGHSIASGLQEVADAIRETGRGGHNTEGAGA